MTAQYPLERRQTPGAEVANVYRRNDSITLRNRAGCWLWALSSLLPHLEWRNGDFRRIYLYHVRKTAGTALIFSFMRLSQTDPHLIDRRLSHFYFAQSHGYRFVADNEALIRQGSYFFAYSHLPAYIINPPEVGTFKFTVLRDPIERVVSLYQYLASPDTDSSYSHKAMIEERRWATEGFDRFLDQIPVQHLRNQLHMFSKSGSVNEAVHCLNKLDMVLRTEYLNRDLNHLQEALDLRFSLTRERSSLLRFVPTDAQRSRLHDLLIPEFEILRQLGPKWELDSSFRQ
jgi:Sulfotransferase family